MERFSLINALKPYHAWKSPRRVYKPGQLVLQNNLGFKHEFTKYLRGGVLKNIYISFRYFQKIAFINEVTTNYSGGFGLLATKHINGLILVILL